MLPPQEQINLFISEQPEWQRKVLVRLRQLIHSMDEGIVEAWRGHAPHFDQEGPVVALHAAKAAVTAAFPKGALLKDPHKLLSKPEKGEDKALRRLVLHEDSALDEKAFTALVKQAVKLNQAEAANEAKAPRKAIAVPAEFEQCLKKDEETWGRWEKLPPSHKREYVEWISDAKQDETRKHRIAQALERIRAGAGQEELPA